MMKMMPLIFVSAGLIAGLAGCGFVSEQLADKAREEQLLKPGALDPAIPTNPYYVKHSFKLLGQYQVSHEWHNLGRLCAYPSSRAEPGSGLRVFDSRGEIVEENGKTFWIGDPSYAQTNEKLWRKDFDQYVRPAYKTQRPEYDEAGRKTGRMLEKIETGLKPVCYEAWVGTSHSTSLMLHRRTVDEWGKLMPGFRKGGYIADESTKSIETIGGNIWLVYRAKLKPREINRIAGAFELAILPIGDSGYTLALELGANQDSLHHPQAHANFQAMFRHLIESVKIEAVQP